MNSNKEYAKALFQIAAEQGKINDFSLELDKIGALLEENPEYTAFLSSPALPLSERLDAVDKAFGDFSEPIVTLIKIMCEKGSARNLTEVLADFAELKREKENSITAQIFSSSPLSDTQKSAIAQKLSKKYGKTVEPQYFIDKALIGGIKVEIDSHTIDNSVSRRLTAIKGVISK